MANTIEHAVNYTSIFDEVYQNAAVAAALNSSADMVRAGANAKEVKIPKLSVTGLGNYTRNVGYKTGNITFEYETRTFNYDRGIKLAADTMDVEESGIPEMFVKAGAELQRTQVAPEGDAFTFATIAQKAGIGSATADYSEAEGGDILKDLRAVVSAMDEEQVTANRILFINPTLNGIIEDYSEVNPNRSKAVLKRFSKIVEVPQSRFYSKIALNDGSEKFGYEKASDGKNINFMVIEPSAIIKFDKHVASRVFSPDELENLDSHMMKYRKYGIVDVFDNKLAGVYASIAGK